MRTNMVKKLKKIKIMTNTGAFGFPWLVAKHENLFKKVGLDVEIVQRDPYAPEEPIFARKKERALEDESVSLYSVCEWGALQRIAEGSIGKVLYIISTKSPFAVMAIDPHIKSPQNLSDVPIGVKSCAGSHYATIRMLEKRIPTEKIKIKHIGGPLSRLETLLTNKLKAVTLMEHYIDLAEFHGARIIVKGNFSEVAFGHGDLPEGIRDKLMLAVREAVRLINKNWKKYQHILLDDIPPRFKHGFIPKTIHYAPPKLYSLNDFKKTKEWMENRGFLKSNLVFQDVIVG